MIINIKAIALTRYAGHMMYAVLICLFSVMAVPVQAQAQWDFQNRNTKAISPKVQEVSSAIATLPETHFFTDDHYRQVKTLLTTTMEQQASLTLEFTAALDSYSQQKNDRQQKNNSHWQQVERIKASLTQLNQNKERLLALADPLTRGLVTGFGPYGVTAFYAELTLTKLNIRYYISYQIRSFANLINDLTISPVPVIVVAIKVLLVFFSFQWWLRNSARLINDFKQSKLKGKKNPSLLVRLFWYLSRADKAIAWLLFITLTLRFISSLPSLQHLIFLEIFTWWILGGSIAVSFILEFISRNSRSNKSHIIALRLSTIRHYVWGVIGTGLILQISARTLGQGTSYAWIESFVYLFFATLTVLTLKNWKTTVFSQAEPLQPQPIWVQWAIKNQDQWFISLLGTACCAVWLMLRSLQHATLAILSQYAAFSHALAYLFRIEVAKQTIDAKEQASLTRIEDVTAFKYVLPGSETSPIIADYADEELQELSRYLLTDSPAVCVLSGERGVGTTTLLRRILVQAETAIPIYINCPYDGYSALLPQLAMQLGLPEDASERQILQYLRSCNEVYLLAIDSAQRLVKPKVGGLAELMRLTNLLRRARKSHRVVIAIEKSSWRFIDRARGERLLFDLVTFMPKWSEKQITELLASRISNVGDHAISFEGLVVPRQWDEDSLTEEERAENGFYRILWDYSDGNPTVALRFFRLSLHRDKTSDKVLVRLFKVPDSDDLESMPKPMLAVLRSIVQLEIASPVDLCECSRLSMAEVISTLRYFQSRGYIEWSEDKARVSDHWFRHITNVLHRQHLLVK